MRYCSGHLGFGILGISLFEKGDKSDGPCVMLQNERICAVSVGFC